MDPILTQIRRLKNENITKEKKSEKLDQLLAEIVQLVGDHIKQKKGPTPSPTKAPLFNGGVSDTSWQRQRNGPSLHGQSTGHKMPLCFLTNNRLSEHPKGSAQNKCGNILGCLIYLLCMTVFIILLFGPLIWWIVDFVRILAGTFPDGNGQDLIPFWNLHHEYIFQLHTYSQLSN